MRFAAAGLLTTLCCRGVSAVPAATVDSARPAEQVRTWRFTVLLDGKPIGTHDFTVAGTADDGRVRSHASFKVTALRVPIYRYEHEDEESWHGGCLVQLDARTRENGNESTVHGRSYDEAFHVLGPNGATILPGCVKSFAYWDKRALTASHMLNAQTGEYEPVEVTNLGTERVDVAHHALHAEHYALAAHRFRLELWYSSADEWLALESRTEQGHTLRYEIR